MLQIEVEDAERLRLRNRPRDVPIMRQIWRRLGFLHWAVEPRMIAGLLPPSLELDLWDGAAYVGLVPFSIRDARPSLFPAVPFLSSFHELNFRTYVHRQGRDPGVWFFSLDAASRAAVALARLAYKLPYHHARMQAIASAGGKVAYRSERDDPEVARFSCTYAPTGPAEPARPATLPFFLIERYLLYSWDDRRLRSARVWHRPYQLQAATVTDLAEDLTAAAGVLVGNQPPLAHYCHELDVRIYPPHLVREPTQTWELETPELASPV